MTSRLFVKIPRAHTRVHVKLAINLKSVTVQISVGNCISVKHRFLVKSSFQFFWGGGENKISNSIYKRDRENKDHEQTQLFLSGKEVLLRVVVRQNRAKC